MVFSVPWLDGPTALSAVLSHSGELTLATTVSLPVIRGPVPLAKTFAAIDRLSDGRLVVAVGPGSSQQDYDSVGIDFSERWARLDESIEVLRVLWRSDAKPFVGRFYSTEGISLDPHPAQEKGPQIWVGSWGSDAGLQRTARLGDGWLASAYNTTPAAVRRRRGHGCEADFPSTARTRSPSPTPWRRCGSTSPRIVTMPIGSCASDRADDPPPRGPPPRASARRSCRAVCLEAFGLRARRRPAPVRLAGCGRGQPARAVLADGAAGDYLLGSMRSLPDLACDRPRSAGGRRR
jgi:hypothetical protein